MQSSKSGTKAKKATQARGASSNASKNALKRPKTSLSAASNKAVKKSTGTSVAEQSIGIRICALAMVLLLVLASASYVPTQPLLIFIYALAALSGTYLSYAFRNDRPRWLSIPPFAGAVLLFANFIFELNFALYAGHAGAVSATAVTAFVHMLSGLLALHCFDLRSRGDFSVSALIGLGLLTFLTGVASRDWIFGAYVLIYTILGGMLLFYDSSSRSHEMGPSRAMQEGQPGQASYLDGQPMVRRLRIVSVTAMLPIFIIPFATAAMSFVLPKGDSMLELVVSSFRAQFPLSANMSGYLSRGGTSQSSKGGVSDEKKEGGSSYSAKGGQGDGTASSAGPATSKGGNNSGSGAGSGSSGQPTANNPKGKGSAMPGLNGKKRDYELADIEKQAQAQEQAREQSWQKEAQDLHSAQNEQDALLLRVTSENPTYVRRYTLDVFDEKGWSRKMPTPGKALDKGKAGFDLTSSDAVYVPPDLPTEEVHQEFRSETALGSFLPHTWLPQVVKIENEEVKIDGDGALKLSTPLPDHTRYSVTSQVPVYDLEAMRRLPPETLLQLDEERVDEIKTAEACLQLPKQMDKRIRDMAADAGGIEGNWFSKAERTAEFLKTHYHYNKISFYNRIDSKIESKTEPKTESKTEPKTETNNQTSWGATIGDTSVPADTSGSSAKAGTGANIGANIGAESRATGAAQTGTTSGASKTGQANTPKENEMARLNEFLFDSKRGNCRHFASSFAILCRAQGIPSRLVVGFLPGELNKKTGYREIRGKDTHVWAEIYVPYWNWVPFDPTPEGKLPAHQEGGNALTKFIASGLANPFGQNTNRKMPRKQSSMPGAGNNQSHHDEKKIDGPKLNFDGAKNKPKGSSLNLPWIGNIEQGQMQAIFKAISVLLFLLIGTIAVIIYLRQRKKAEVQQLIGDQQPSTVVFLEVLADLKRFEFTKLPTETADELSDRARTQFARLSSDGRQFPKELSEVVSEFMRLYTEERFGGSDNLGELHELSRQIKALSQIKAGK